MKHIRIDNNKLKKAIKNIWLNQRRVAEKIWMRFQNFNVIIKTWKTSNETLIKIIKVLNEDHKIKIDEERYFIKKLNKPYTYNDFFRC